MSKPTRIFLIIGLTKESAHWDDHFVQSLKDKFQTDDVIGIDLPGAGAFLDKKSPLSMEGVVKETRANYQKYLDGSTHNILVSISLGGMVATEWLKHYPSDFEKFVIVNSSFRGFSPVHKRVQPWAMKKFFKVFLAGSEDEREHHVIDLCTNNSDVYDYTKEKWVKLAKERPMAKVNMVRQLIAATRYSPDHKPEIPTLIIAARHDKLAHFSCSEKLQEKWQKDFHIIEDEKVGHGVHIDAPQELAKVIHDWATA
jgi:pimeloyl-[acyl-carrier protein] methyl ester esterase